MEHYKKTDALTHDYSDGAVRVIELGGNSSINDAEITLTVRYPNYGYAVNDVATALISVESGSGSIAIMGSDTRALEQGDRVIVSPQEPYFLQPIGQMVIRYIAAPAWSAEQSRIIEDEGRNNDTPHVAL